MVVERSREFLLLHGDIGLDPYLSWASWLSHGERIGKRRPSGRALCHVAPGWSGGSPQARQKQTWKTFPSVLANDRPGRGESGAGPSSPVRLA